MSGVILLGSLWIPFRLPGMNELLDARMRVSSAGKEGLRPNRYSSLKSKVEASISLLARGSGIPRGVPHCYLTYLFSEPNRKRDPGNMVGAAAKLVEDGLQRCGVLSNDGWENILGYAFYWMVSSTVGTLVALSEERPLTEDEAKGQMDANRQAVGSGEQDGLHHRKLSGFGGRALRYRGAG